MTDVRLVATNPDDGVLVPVASNASGQLAVQSPKIEKIPNDLEVEGTVTATGFVGDGSSLTNLPSGPPPTPPFDGNLDGDLTVGGKGSFGGTVLTGEVTVGKPGIGGCELGSSGVLSLQVAADTPCFAVYLAGNYVPTISFDGSGGATFSDDVVVGSRGSKWLIRESNGVAMLVEQALRKPNPVVRDLPRELDLIEAALNEIMGKLKMIPPAGWEVWDGSDNSQ